MKRKSLKSSWTVIIMMTVMALSCKKDEDVFPNSTLPADYDNQGTILVKNNNIKICIWDWSVVDGDVIDLLINGRTVLSKYELVDEQKCLEVKLPDGENWIGIIAINQGTLNAASPHVEITDGSSTQAFDIEGYIDKPGGYTIKVQK
jgi:hypothetical protein